MTNSMCFTNSFIETEGIYFIGNRTFDYSDGDKAEAYVSAVIKGTKDLSSNSLELESAITDWSSRYHFSRDRSNCYRSMQFPKDSEVLEIGSGCGAITRYLAENVAKVVALEGSSRRAKITRSRTRDLDNVTVICGSFEDVRFNRKFDYVICNGVLEYAPLFVSCEDPVQRFLELLSSLIKPSGSIIIAIENKLGLRYFSSGKEEHTGIMFDGLEGYSRFPNGPKTFGNLELRTKLLKCFTSIDVLLPLPDYKTPTAVIHESLIEIADCSELFSATDRYDFGSAISPMLHERLAWHALNEAKLLPQFANSFFFIAGHNKTALIDSSWLGDIYSNGRKPEYVTRTQIVRSPDGHVNTIKKRMLADYAHDGAFLSHKEINGDWINGPSIHTLLTRAFVRRDRNLSLDDRIREPIRAWWSSLQNDLDGEGKLPGRLVDCIWQNFIYYKGESHHFDEEWVLKDRIAALVLIYRSVISFAGKEISFIHRWAPKSRGYTQLDLIRSVARLTGVPFSFASLIDAVKLDLEFALASRGHNLSFWNCFVRLFVPLNTLRFKALFYSWLRANLTRIGNRLARFIK